MERSSPQKVARVCDKHVPGGAAVGPPWPELDWPLQPSSTRAAASQVPGGEPVRSAVAGCDTGKSLGAPAGAARTKAAHSMEAAGGGGSRLACTPGLLAPPGARWGGALAAESESPSTTVGTMQVTVRVRDAMFPSTSDLWPYIYICCDTIHAR